MMEFERHNIKGFTLVELMIAIVVMVILVAMAVPLYTRYVVSGAEGSVQSQMSKVSSMLAKHRFDNLSYRWFDWSVEGLLCGQSACTGVAGVTQNTFTWPLGSTGSNVQYTVTLVDTTQRVSLATLQGTSQQWTMLAAPNKPSNVLMTTASYMLFNSDGLACKTTDVLTISSTSCGSTGRSW